MNHLPDNLEYTGEFGAELVLFVPLMNYLSEIGELKHRNITTYKGMKCFYDHMKCQKIIEKSCDRIYLSPQDRPSWLPIKNEHTFDGKNGSPKLYYPDYRKKFKNKTIKINTEKQILIVHNKFCNEWNSGPINYYSPSDLDIIFSILKHHYTIIYIRHGIEDLNDGFSKDHNEIFEMDDLAVLEKHKEVILFDDIVRNNKEYDLNTVKNIIYSRCYRFLSVQGGGCHQIAMFSGSLISILHRRGQETNLAYKNGYYNILCNPSSIRTISTNMNEVKLSFNLFIRTSVFEDRILINPEHKNILDLLSPKRF